MAGRLFILCVLLQHSANPDLQSSTGCTALTQAAGEGKEACVQAAVHPAGDRVAMPKTKRDILVDGRRRRKPGYGADGVPLNLIWAFMIAPTLGPAVRHSRGWGSCLSRQPRTAGPPGWLLLPCGQVERRFLRARRNEYPGARFAPIHPCPRAHATPQYQSSEFI